MKKMLIGIVTSAFLLVGSVGVNAEGKNNNKKPVVKPEVVSSVAFPLVSEGTKYSYSVPIDSETTMFFQTKKDYLNYLNMQKSKNGGISLASGTGGYITKPTKISSKRIKSKWVGYHKGTPNWSPASDYTIDKGKSFSISNTFSPYKGFPVQIGFTYSTSVSTKIPADSSRESRLGVWGDFTFTKNKWTEYRYGKPTGKKPTYSVSVKRHSYTIKPKYRK